MLILICTVVTLYCFVMCVCVCVCVCVFWSYVYRTLNEVFLTLTEVFLALTEVCPCFFLSCKANPKVVLAKTGHGPQSSKLVVICVVLLLFVLFLCKCVLYYCHRVTIQLQLKNISYHILKQTININVIEIR